MKDHSAENDFANIDASELAKFEAMAPIWWDKNGVQKPLHDINVLRVDYINTRAPLAGKNVLRVGCGGGILSEAMAVLGAVVTGIDASQAPLAVAKMHLKESGLRIDYRIATAESYCEAHSDRFDVVTCLELLEHVPKPASVVAACHCLVKPGGDVIFATLNRNLKSFLFAIIGAEYLLRMVRRGTHSQWHSFKIWGHSFKELPWHNYWRCCQGLLFLLFCRTPFGFGFHGFPSV